MASVSSSQFSKPRKVSVLANYEKTVLSAFKCDCESFLEQFEKENTLNYADFANIWQKNNFTYIYADMVRIRLTLEEYKKIKHVMDEMLNKGQYDILYIFAKMKSDNVFLYTAEPKPLNIEFNKSIKNMSHLDDTFQNRGTESSINKFKDILKDETVQGLQKTCSEYDALLNKYADKHPSVHQLKSTIINDINNAHNKVFGKISTESKDSQSDDTEIRNTRQSIRLRALQNKNAEYRGSKKVLTAVDLDYEDDDEFVETPLKKSPKQKNGRGRAKGAKRKNLGKKGA